MTEQFRQRLEAVTAGWRTGPRPARTEMAAMVADLSDWRLNNNLPGLWDQPPALVTATVDDALGHGIALIEQTAAMTGIHVHALGIMPPPDAISETCRELLPDLLGLTMLQFDSEDVMTRLSRSLPAETLLVAGGPPLFADPELADWCGVHQVIRDAAEFIEWLLSFQPMKAPRP